MQPLPVAAAHHPASIRKIRTPIYVLPKENTVDSNNIVSTTESESHASIALSACLEREKSTQTALLDALARTQRVGEGVSEQLTQMRIESGKSGNSQHENNFTLWEEHDVPLGGVNFNVRFPALNTCLSEQMTDSELDTDKADT